MEKPSLKKSKPMKKRIDKYLPDAFRLVKEHLADKATKTSVPEVYKGYISSMGASIILSGLLPTLAFYNADTENSSSKESRRPLLTILHEMLKERYLLPNQQNLIYYAIALQEQKRNSDLRKLRKDVVDASIAIKLAMRTFHMKEK
jgi:CRISPR-associated protein Cmr5